MDYAGPDASSCGESKQLLPSLIAQDPPISRVI